MSTPAENPRPKRRRPNRRRLILTVVVALVLVAVLISFGSWRMMIDMPGESFRGELPKLSEPQTTLRDQLQRDVEKLALDIGERNIDRLPALNAAADFIQQQFQAAGYDVARQTYTVRGVKCFNVEVELRGTEQPDEIVVIGGHYDSVVGTPGANDNASGTAAVLALARRFADSQPRRTLRFVAFTNEEPPYFQNDDMGSWVYAHRCRQRNENVVAMISLETIGYYSDEPGSQSYPPPLNLFYPSAGNFIAVVGNVGSRPLVHQVIESFRRHGQFPSEGGAVPGDIEGVGWSDHWSFWQEGYQAVMITDTAPFRYAYYHQPGDTPDKLNFDHMARVVDGLTGVVRDLAGIDDTK